MALALERLTQSLSYLVGANLVFTLVVVVPMEGEHKVRPYAG